MGRSPSSHLGIIARLAPSALMVAVLVVGCGKRDSAATGGSNADAVAAPVPSASASAASEPPAPPTPDALLEQHRKEMASAAEDGRYADVCAGTPWFNQTICTWAAGKAAGKSPARPGGDVFHPFFVSQHWAKVYGQIIADADSNGDYEVSVGGYKHHCILDTDETKFSTKGAFHMWVQEQPDTREVTVNSGATQQWVVLEEATLATMLMELAHAGGGVEATASAKNIMGLIATFVPYTEKKGQLPALPGAPPASSASSSAAPGAAPRTRATSAAEAPASPPAAPPSPPPLASAKAPVNVPVVNPNLPRIQTCCASLHAAALHASVNQAASAKDLKHFTAAATQCDLLSSQVAGGAPPNLATVAHALKGRPLPAACAGM